MHAVKKNRTVLLNRSLGLGGSICQYCNNNFLYVRQFRLHLGRSLFFNRYLAVSLTEFFHIAGETGLQIKTLSIQAYQHYKLNIISELT